MRRRRSAPVADPELEVLLTQYESVRAESVQAIGNRLTVMSFTFAALSVLTAGLLTRSVSDALAGAIAVVFVPQLAKAGLLVWLGEHERSQRAGKFLCVVESRIQELFGRDVLGWETWLGDRRAPTPEAPWLHMRYPYLAVVALLLGVGWVAEGIGVYLIAQAADDLDAVWTVAIVVGIAALCLAYEARFLAFFRSRWDAVR